MTDDKLIDDAFGAFRDGDDTLPEPLGAGAARATVRARRRHRALATGALLAAVVAVPVTAYASGGLRDATGPPVGATTQAVPQPSGEAPDPSIGPTAPPSVLPTSSPPADTRGIPRTDLDRATLDLPSWPGAGGESCPDGRVKLTGGRATPKDSSEVALRKVAYADVNGDGDGETAVLLHCQVAESGEQAVIVLDRVDDVIVTLGALAHSDLAGHDNGRPELITDVRADGSRFEVRVGDLAACCGIPESITQLQWRSYSWTGDAFAQTGGPRTFPDNPHVTDLRVQTEDVTGTIVDGTATGTLRVTVRNAGPVAPPAALTLDLPESLTLRDGPKACRGSGGHVCDLGKIPVGESVTLTFTVSGPAADFPAGSAHPIRVEALTPVDPAAHRPEEAFPDVNDEDNGAEPDFRVS